MLCLAFVGLTTSLFGQKYVNREWVEMAGIPDTVQLVASTFDIDQNLLVAGNTFVGPQNTDILLTKYNRAGELLWQQSFGGIYRDYAVAVCTDLSNNIYVAGVKTAETTATDYAVLKYSPSGTLLWSSEWNGSSNLYDIPTCITSDLDGNVFVSGTTLSLTSQTDYATIKLNAVGALQWVGLYNYANLHDFATAITLSLNGDVIVTGGSASATNAWDFTTIKYNQTTGSQIAESRVNIPGAGIDKAAAMIRDNAGNLYLTGYTYTNGQRDIQTVKLSPTLGLLWSQTFDGEGLDDEGVSLGIDDDQNVYIVGFTSNLDGGSNMLTVKYDSSGNEVWVISNRARTFAEVCKPTKVVISSSDEVCVTGYRSSPSNIVFETIMYDTDGRTLWQSSYSGGNGYDIALDVKSDSIGNIYVTGLSGTNNGVKYATVKYAFTEREDGIAYDSEGQPHHFSNQLIVNFHADLLNLAFIDDRNAQFADIVDVLPTNVIVSLESALGFDFRNSRVNVLKIYSNSTSNDTIDITRMGDTIRAMQSWASLLVQFEDSVDLETALASLNSLDSIVAYAQYCHVYRPFADDPYYSLQTALHPDGNGIDASINVEPAWELMYTGLPDVHVAVLDGLIWHPHEEFTWILDPGGQDITVKKVVDGKSYLGFNNPYLYDLTSSDLMTYSNTHGTACAGIVGATKNNDKGIHGIAGGTRDNPNLGVSLYSLGIALESGFIDEAAALEAIEFGLDEFEIDVTNMSWGTGSFSLEMYRQLRQAWRKQVVLVAARGNSQEPSDLKVYPACLRDSMMMNVAGSGKRGWYNNGENDEGDEDIATGYASMFDGNIDIVAPGVTNLVKTTIKPTDLMSFEDVCTVDGNLYGCFNKTSAAAPHAAGVAALVMSFYNIENGAPDNLTPDDIQALVEQYASDINYIDPFLGINYDTYNGNYDPKNGHGRLNAGAVLEVLHYPAYEVFHSDLESPPNGGTEDLPQLGVPFINLWEDINGNNVGVYAPVVKHKVTHTYHHEFPEYMEIIGAWPRFSSVIGYSSEENVWDEPWGSYTFNIQGNIIDIVVETYCWEISDNLVGPPKYLPDEPFSLKTPYSIHLRNNNLVNVEATVSEVGGITIQPNPTLDNMTVILPDGMEAGMLLIETLTGQEVFRLACEQSKHSLNISTGHLSSGTYICRFVTEKGCMTTRFIKL